MRNSTKQIICALIDRYSSLSICKVAIEDAVNALTNCYRCKKKVLICGNGGSAADSEHIVGELMKGFLLERKMPGDDQRRLRNMCPDIADYLIDNLQVGLPAISLVSHTALTSAFANDKEPELPFAQQILGYGQEGDILIAITTSGNSKNIVYAAQIAKLKGMKVVALTGRKGGAIKGLADILINVPSDETFIIQEYHLPVYHALCAGIENEFFSNED